MSLENSSHSEPSTPEHPAPPYLQPDNPAPKPTIPNPSATNPSATNPAIPDCETSSLISPAHPQPHDRTFPKLRLGVMASGSGSNFEAIAQAIETGVLNAEIALVIYNNPKAGVIDRAARFNIPTVLLDHRQYTSREALDGAIVATLQDAAVEWVIMAGWMRIVTPVLIDAFPDRILNIHPSLLPSFKGGRAIEQAFQSGVKITGCTVHYVVAEVDSGKILIQAAVPIHSTDQLADLQHRIQAQEHRIYPQAIAIAAQQAQLQTIGGTIGERLGQQLGQRSDRWADSQI